jgi:hypothetical protein
MNRKERRKQEKLNRKTVNVLKTIKLSDIKTPTTVEEFRENLKKCFWNEACREDALYVRTEDKDAHGIPYTSINSFADIYTLTGTGFGGDNSSPMVVPMFDFDMDDVSEHMEKTNQYWSAHGFFHDDYKLYVRMKDCKNPSWFTLDNQILREFYMKVCGEFSGYGVLKEVA